MNSKKLVALAITVVIIILVIFRLFYHPLVAPMSVRNVVGVYKSSPSMVKIGDVQITFKSVSLAKELFTVYMGYVPAKEGHNFLNIDYIIENVGEEEVTIDLDNEYFVGIKFDTGYSHEDRWGGTPLKPGSSVAGSSGFEIPEDIKPVELIIYHWTKDNPLYILKLQPL